MKVFKYALNVGGSTYFDLPAGAEVLAVGIQGTPCCLWARVNPDAKPDAKPETHRFFVAGTGMALPLWADRYVGTCFDPEPAPGFPNGFVWHVFEESGRQG